MTVSVAEPELLLHQGQTVSLIECQLTQISANIIPTEKYALISINAQLVSNTSRQTR